MNERAVPPSEGGARIRRREAMHEVIVPRWPLPDTAPEGVGAERWALVRDYLSGDTPTATLVERYGLDLPPGYASTRLERLVRDTIRTLPGHMPTIPERRAIGAVLRAGYIYRSEATGASNAALRRVRNVGPVGITLLRRWLGETPTSRQVFGEIILELRHDLSVMGGRLRELEDVFDQLDAREEATHG